MAVFIQKGDAFIPAHLAALAGRRIVTAELAAAGARSGDEILFQTIPHTSLPARLLAVLAALPGSPTTYVDYAMAWENDNDTGNAPNNYWNWQRKEYLKAVARLAQRDLSVDYPATEVGTGEFGPDPDTGELVEVMQTVPAIPALVAEDTKYPVLDAEGVPTGETVTEPNREVQARLDQDAAERAAAQAVVDATPQEVKDFDAG